MKKMQRRLIYDGRVVIDVERVDYGMRRQMEGVVVGMHEEVGQVY